VLFNIVVALVQALITVVLAGLLLGIPLTLRAFRCSSPRSR
jgi:hypothetical protein